MSEDLLKQILRPIADYAFDFLGDEERMNQVWEWLEEKAAETDIPWDDAAVKGAKAVFPALLDMADEFVTSLLDD